MSACGRVAVAALVVFCLGNFGSAQDPDQLAVARVLGAQWEQMVRASGIVFAGTVLSVTPSHADPDHALPTVEVKFRVDQGIAGVQPGQILTVRAWAGAWSAQPAIRQGQRLLLLLYPRSRLGLTSPVGGALGQVGLDADGKNAVVPNISANEAPSMRPPLRRAARQSVTLVQLERAIRSAREE